MSRAQADFIERRAVFMKKIITKIKKLPLKKKIRIAAAAVLTACFVTVAMVSSWFSNQKKAAEMYKVEYPNALYINAAYREDQVYFDLGGIEVNGFLRDENHDLINADGTPLGEDDEPVPITKKEYVFSVSGSNTTQFILQMAHTNNNMFTYKVYNATQVTTKPASGEYITFEPHLNSHTENPLLEIGSDIIDKNRTDPLYYIKGEQILGDGVNSSYKNPTGTYSGGVVLANKSTADKTYYYPTYGDNTEVEAHSVPSYWQTTLENTSAEIDANKRFRKYFILEVTWPNRPASTEENETDLMYFSAKRIA